MGRRADVRVWYPALIALTACAHAAASGDDCLMPLEAPEYKQGTAYELATARTLYPRSARLLHLQMTTMPSSEAGGTESAVYLATACPEEGRCRVDQRATVVGVARAKRSIWAAFEQDSAVPGHRGDPWRAFAWPGLEPAEVELVEAPLSGAAFAALTAAWESALQDLCPLIQRDHGPIYGGVKVDGVIYDFTTLGRTGRAHSPAPGSSAEALVTLGDQLAALARSEPKDRPALEAKLIVAAEAVRARFAGKAP